MGEIQEIQLHVKGGQEENPPKAATSVHPPLQFALRRWRWWLLVFISIAFLLSGQAVGNLLGRFYFDKGGNSRWLATLVQFSAFPILLPLYLLPRPVPKSPQTSIKTAISTLAFIYIFFGIVILGNCLLYTYGLQYLPVSTYSLVCATQLAFNAVFSYFINGQKFTPLIFNSVVLLTFSASLLAVQTEQAASTHSRIPPGKYVAGFLFTIGASASYSLLLSLVQLTFQKFLKKETLSAILDIQIYPALVATCGGIVGLFASGEWRDLKGEMERFEEGKLAYVLTVVWTAVAWQVFSFGCTTLIYEVSSLFSNVISTLGLPIVPIFAFVFFHDGISGVKIVAMLLAIWGFLSYIYQQYLDESSKVAKSTKNAEIPLVSA